MSSFSAIISKDAKLDIKSASSYIEFTLHNPSATDSLLNELNKEIRALEDNPFISAVVDDPFFKPVGLRFSIIKNYLLFYTVSPQEKTITILRFLYGRRNWQTILRQSFTVK